MANKEIFKNIESIVNKNKVVLFMKGSKDFPQCGFSATVVNILNQLNIEFSDINVLDDVDLRQAIKEYTDWPTIPQLYVNGEFVGGCDIIKEMYLNKELQELFTRKSGE